MCIYIYYVHIFIDIYIHRHVKPTRSLLFKEKPSLTLAVPFRFMVRCRPIQRLSMTSPSASLFGIGTMVTILSVCWMHFSALVAMGWLARKRGWIWVVSDEITTSLFEPWNHV
jgi:hypothetical protein